jgi:hypothetical protein
LGRYLSNEKGIPTPALRECPFSQLSSVVHFQKSVERFDQQVLVAAAVPHPKDL